MAKSDFEFYEVDGISRQFVRPAVNSDPYRGQFVFDDLELQTIKGVVSVVEELTGVSADTKIRVADLDDLSGYLFDKKTQDGVEVAGRVIEVRVDLDDPGDQYYSAEFGAIYREFSRTRRVGYSLGVSAVREVEVCENCISYEDDITPVHPTATLRQVIPVRAHMWLPGPERKSQRSEGLVLPPTYSPRPVGLVLAQLFKVTGINPRVESVAQAAGVE
jgi:hypothetical protein